jgi:carboxylesterase type B
MLPLGFPACFFRYFTLCCLTHARTHTHTHTHSLSLSLSLSLFLSLFCSISLSPSLALSCFLSLFCSISLSLSRSPSLALSLSPSLPLSCFLSLSLSLSRSHAGRSCKQSIAWAPIVDGVEILAAPWVRAQAGHHAQVPIIIGTNRDEGASFIPLSPHASAADFEAWLNTSYGPLAGQIGALYPVTDYPALPCCSSYFLAAEHISGDFSMTCPTRRAARWFSRDQQPTFLYMFTKDPVPLPVAPHACEIPFVFMAHNLLYSPADVATSAHMSSLWNNFALHANPNPADAPDLWPAYNATTDTNLFINVKLSTGTGLRRAQCDFWDKVQVDRCF